jgi:hypothetical protein
MSIGITVNADPALQRLAAVRRALAPKRVNRTAAGGLASYIRRYLAAYDSEHPNKLDGARTHFYANAAKVTHVVPGSGDSSVIAISMVGFGQRLYGGTIKPAHEGRFLTIPLTAAAYGQRIGKFMQDKPKKEGAKPRPRANPNAKFIMSFNGGAVKFLLVAQVTQAPNRDVLPDDDTMHDVAAMAVDNSIARAAGQRQLVRRPATIDLTPAYKPNAYAAYDEEY